MNSDGRRLLWLDIIAGNRQRFISFLKVVENLAKREEGRSVKVLIRSLTIYEAFYEKNTPSQTVIIKDALRNFKVEKFFDLEHSWNWIANEPFFKQFTEVAIFYKSVISFQACKNLHTLEVNL